MKNVIVVAEHKKADSNAWEKVLRRWSDVPSNNFIYKWLN